MTTQEAYELMRVYLTRPGAQRAISNLPKVCRYETIIDGELQRCAIGCLLSPETLAATVEIDDETDAPEWQVGLEVELRDFCGSLDAIYMQGYTLPELDDVSHNFLAEAQSIHDCAGSWREGKFDVRLLDGLAEKHGLTVVTEESQRTPSVVEEVIVV